MRGKVPTGTIYWQKNNWVLTISCLRHLCLDVLDFYQYLVPAGHLMIARQFIAG